MANDLYGGNPFGGNPWRNISYEMLPVTFMDNFLLRYFYRLIKTPDYTMLGSSPWKAFVTTNPWVAEMPDLYQQLTGYQLTEGQLDQAVVDYCQRIVKVLTFKVPKPPAAPPMAARDINPIMAGWVDRGPWQSNKAPQIPARGAERKVTQTKKRKK